MTPASTAKAVIWDMDGVIADTAACHFEAWQEVFQKRGITYTKENFRRYFGQRNEEIIRKVCGEEVSQALLDAIASEKNESFYRKINQNLKAFPGVIELIIALSKRGFKMAVASSAPLKNIKFILRRLEIDDCFQAIVSGKDVKQGKPSPQAFLLAARKLGVEPNNCVVIEDALAGVAAAKNAGMRCIAVTNTNPKESLTEADLIVDTLEALSASDLEKILAIS